MSNIRFSASQAIRPRVEPIIPSRRKGLAISAALLGALFATTNVQALEVHSPDLKNGATMGNQYVFKGFGCEGDNQSPAVAWSGAPAGTKSFAITMYDPDAPTGSGWWHWLAFNLPVSTQALPAGAGTADGSALPAGTIQSRTDFGSTGYGGPCPPVGDKPHHYQLTVFALDIDKLPADANSSGALVGYMLHAHTLEKAQITWRYGR